MTLPSILTGVVSISDSVKRIGSYTGFCGIIPTEIIDRTLDDVKKASPILKLVNMAPANVKKWIVASHTGAAVWGALTDSVKGELSTEISALNIDLHMLTAYLVIPKAKRLFYQLSY